MRLLRRISCLQCRAENCSREFQLRYYNVVKKRKIDQRVKDLEKVKAFSVYIYILSAISFTLTISFLLTITLPILIVGAALVKFSI